MTVQDLVTHALEDCGRLKPGGTPGTVESAVGLRTLNAMLDTWKTERLMVYAEVRTEFDIISGQQTYSIGTGANWDVERPERIERAEFIFTNTSPEVEVPVKILSPQEWAALTPKKLTNTIQTMLYYEPTVPNGTVTLWPKPTQNWKIAVWTWRTIGQFASLATTINLPPGYQEAIEYNLAVKLADKYPDTARVSQVTVEAARSAKRKIKTMNEPVLQMQCEGGDMGVEQNAGRRWNIFSNQYNP